MTTSTGQNDWFTSSYSGGNNNTCVEARFTARGTDVRDSKAPHHGHLSFTTNQWTAFLATARTHHLDR